MGFLPQPGHSFGYRGHAGTWTPVCNAAGCVFCRTFLWLYNKVVVFEILMKLYFDHFFYFNVFWDLNFKYNVARVEVTDREGCDATIYLKNYSLRPKINTILNFKICPTKNINFDPPTKKTNQFSKDSHKKTTNTSFTHHKRQRVFW